MTLAKNPSPSLKERLQQPGLLVAPGVFSSMVLLDTTSRRPPNAQAMWGDRIAMAQAGGMAALIDSTLTRWFTAPFRAANPAIMARIEAGLLATPVAGFCGCCEAISKVDVFDRLPEIDCPALVMVGDQDHGTPPEMARLSHQNLRGSQFIVIPDAAHISNIEQPEFFNRELLKFLAQQAA